jgi:molybdopterin biosynthesis enzyme
MVAVEEARQIIESFAAPLGLEEVAGVAADGRVLAEDV